MKKVVSFIATIAFAGSLTAFNAVPLISSAIRAITFVEDGTYELGGDSSLEYKVTSDGEVYITGCQGTAPEVKIPSEINGKKVNTIASGAFRDHTELTSVTIPDSVTDIVGGAFQGCSGLTSVTIPDSIPYINDSTFKDCTHLKSVTLPENIRYIGFNAFENCTELDTINIPENIENVLHDAFKNTKWYDDQPDGLVIAAHVLYNYKGTMPENTSVEIPEGVRTIGFNAFEDCTNMTSVTIPEGVTDIGSYAFKGCTGLTSLTIPGDVKMIGAAAFADCTGLTSLTLDEGVENIQNAAFDGCTALNSLNLPKSLKIICSYAFSNCTSLTEVAIPEGVEYIMNNAFTGSSNLAKVTIPKIKEATEGIDTIENDVFLNCSPNMTIYGYKGTLAERYANDNGIRFSALDPDTTQKTVTTTTAATSNTNSPKTGDSGIVGLEATGIAAAAVLIFSRKRKT
ncbi:MAG: leucine-rich repeat protein [Ruminococcus sp.]|nr:leucine-rich repeat protein [Ruminococcus sp.]